MSVDVKYATRATATGGREGNARSEDGRFEAKLSTPKELGGAGGDGTNPEQLFAAGYSACFIGAIGLAARERKLAMPADTAVDAEVDLRHGERGYVLQARLNVALPGLDRETAGALVDAAHQTCPYSKATRGNIEVEINLV